MSRSGGLQVWVELPTLDSPNQEVAQCHRLVWWAAETPMPKSQSIFNLPLAWWVQLEIRQFDNLIHHLSSQSHYPSYSLSASFPCHEHCYFHLHSIPSKIPTAQIRRERSCKSSLLCHPWMSNGGEASTGLQGGCMGYYVCADLSHCYCRDDMQPRGQLHCSDLDASLHWTVRAMQQGHAQFTIHAYPDSQRACWWANGGRWNRWRLDVWARQCWSLYQQCTGANVLRWWSVDQWTGMLFLGVEDQGCRLNRSCNS